MAVPVRIQPHPFKKNIARLVREGSITLGDSSLVDDGMIKVFNATPDDLMLGSIAGNLAGLCKGLADASSLLSRQYSNNRGQCLVLLRLCQPYLLPQMRVEASSFAGL
jgi:hypothetical protein